jgi:phosphatidate cytidylyltransferase
VGRDVQDFEIQDWFATANLRWLFMSGLIIFAPMSEPASVMPPLSKAQVFLRRSFSTFVLWAVVLAAMFSTNHFVSDGVFLVLIVTLALTGLMEFYGLAGNRGLSCFPVWGTIGGVLLMIGTFLHLKGLLGTINGSPARVNDFETSFLILFVLGLCVRQLCAKENPNGLAAIAVTLFGLMYVPWLLNFIQKINYFPGLGGDGKYYVFYFILLTKFSDTGAYVVGSLIGRHKMIPRISPGKTWEGFGGALVVSTGMSLLFVHFFGAHMLGINQMHAVILGLILGSTAVVGDLIESLFKREAGMKDSGKMFPGIGGILDLLDSLLFNAPIMYLYLRHILTNP